VKKKAEMAATAGEGGKRKFEFKSSQLSGAADRLWKQRQTEFSQERPSPFHLDLKQKKEESETNNSSSGLGSVSTDFVFGSRVGDRVIDAEKGETEKEDDTPKPVTSLFRHLTETAGDKASTSREENNAKSAESLKESAEATEKKRAVNALPDEVQVTTGEEGEENVIHIACKLHLYDVTQNKWLERGNATLRVNDRALDGGVKETRIVGRINGNQRVLLNSKIWPEMLLEKATSKRIKISALNPDVTIPHQFLITASESSISELFDILEERLITAKHSSCSQRKRKADDVVEGEDKVAENKTSVKAKRSI